MKKSFLIISCLVLAIVLHAQKIGSWSTHFSYEGNIDKLVQVKDLVYVLTEGKFYSYNTNDDYLEIYYKKDGGNDSIINMSYNKANEALLLIRNNNDIDIFYEGGTFNNVPDLKNATQNIDKTINSVYVDSDFAYISTNFGLVVLNVKKREIKETLLFNKPFYASCILDGMIYAATRDGVIRANVDDNILDEGVWEKFELSSKYPSGGFTDSQIRDIVVFRNKLNFLVPNRGVYTLENSENVSLLNGNGLTKIDYVSNDRLISSKANGFWDLTDNAESSVLTEGVQYVIPNSGKSNEYWAGLTKHSLSLLKKGEDSAVEIVSDLKRPQGPLTNFPFFMTHQGGQLCISGGGYLGNGYNYPGVLSLYDGTKWTLYHRDDFVGQEVPLTDVRDFTSVAVDPFDPTHIFVGSWGQGLYEFLGGKFKHQYTVENTNGVLQDIFNKSGFRRIDGLQFDKAGNLWLLNSMVSTPIKVLTKGGTWAQIYHKEIEDLTQKTNTRTITIDRYNRKWISSFAGTPYLFILDDNNTPSNLNDDRKKYTESFYDQDSKSLGINKIYTTKEDQNGNIWLATDVGPFVVYNSSNVFSRDIVFNKIKIPRNDGTNNADILLEGVGITSMEIDGANRKWLGTSSGLYLVTGNGLETVHYFTMDNSPLPSNEILSLAVDPKTGVVYVGTARGIVSFVSDATEGNAEFSEVYAYPNPVRPEYEGVIAITGLMRNSTVKITDMKGNLINQGQSLGGQYTWDGRNRGGKRVDTGVYLVFGSSEDGTSGVVTKILVVN